MFSRRKPSGYQYPLGFNWVGRGLRGAAKEILGEESSPEDIREAAKEAAQEYQERLEIQKALAAAQSQPKTNDSQLLYLALGIGTATSIAALIYSGHKRK